MVLAPKRQPMKIEAKVSFDEARSLFDLRFRALGTNCKALFAAASREQATAFVQEAGRLGPLLMRRWRTFSAFATI